MARRLFLPLVALVIGSTLTGAARAESNYFRSLGPVPVEDFRDLINGTTETRAWQSKISGDGSRSLLFLRTVAGERQFVVIDNVTGTYRSIDVPERSPVNPFLLAKARHISADGNVVIGEDADRNVFRWSEQTGFEFLQDSNGTALKGFPMGVSADGSKIVGQSIENPPSYSRQGFEWNTSTRTALPVTIPLEFRGQAFDFPRLAVGLSDDGSTVVMSDVALSTLFGPTLGYDIQPLGSGVFNVPKLATLGIPRFSLSVVSSDGSVIVSPDETLPNSPKSFRYKQGSLETISGMLAMGVSGNGETLFGVQSTLYPSGNVGLPLNSPTIWTQQTGVVPFDELLQSAGLGNNIDANSRVSFLMDVSDDGKTFLGLRTRWTDRLALGTYQLDYFVARVPEASSTLLVGIALFVLGAGRFLLPRRRIF